MYKELAKTTKEENTEKCENTLKHSASLDSTEPDKQEEEEEEATTAEEDAKGGGEGEGDRGEEGGGAAGSTIESFCKYLLSTANGEATSSDLPAAVAVPVAAVVAVVWRARVSLRNWMDAGANSE